MALSWPSLVPVTFTRPAGQSLSISTVKPHMQVFSGIEISQPTCNVAAARLSLCKASLSLGHLHCCWKWNSFWDSWACCFGNKNNWVKVQVGETVKAGQCGSRLHLDVGCFYSVRPAEKERQQCAVFALCGTASCSWRVCGQLYPEVNCGFESWRLWSVYKLWTFSHPFCEKINNLSFDWKPVHCVFVFVSFNSFYVGLLSYFEQSAIDAPFECFQQTESNLQTPLTQRIRWDKMCKIR